MIDDDYINSVIDTLDKNVPRYRKNNIYLSEFQISVLKRFDIDYTKYNDIKSIIFEIEDILNNDNDPELEKVSLELSEFNYYNNTNK